MTFYEYTLQALQTEQTVANYVERKVSDFLSQTKDDGDFHDASWLNVDVLAAQD